MVAYTVPSRSGRQMLIYRPDGPGTSGDHVAGKWYAKPFWPRGETPETAESPVRLGPYDCPEDAVRAAQEAA